MAKVKNRRFVSGEEGRVFLMTSSENGGLTASLDVDDNITGFTTSVSGGDVNVHSGVSVLSTIDVSADTNKIDGLLGVEFGTEYEDEELEFVDGTFDTHYKPQKKVATATLKIIRENAFFELLNQQAPFGVSYHNDTLGLQADYNIHDEGYGYRVIVVTEDEDIIVLDHLTITKVSVDTSDKYEAEVLSIEFNGNYWKAGVTESATGTAIPLGGA